MAKIKTVPNQKVVRVNKEECDTTHLYAKINLAAMEAAAQNLDAAAFKLWVYFSKNQDDYLFALSSRDVENTFGMKKGQYDTAIKKLIEGGYLIAEVGSNQYIFNEIPVVAKQYNVDEQNKHVVAKQYNVVVAKQYNALLQNNTRNITDITLDTTIGESLRSSQEQTIMEIEVAQEPIKRRKEKIEAFRF